MNALTKSRVAARGNLVSISVARRNAICIAAITLLSMLYQSRWGTNTDTSWLITVCEKVLDGRRLYVDIHETNPPFSVWLYMPPVAAARLLGLAPEIAVQAWTYLAAIVGLVLAGRVVRRAGFTEAPALFELSPAFYAMLVLFPGNAFSQREHIAAALFLPLMALMAWRARVTAISSPSAGLAVLVGLSASTLVLVKPYYSVMVLVPALYVAIRQRSMRPIFAIEHWVIGIVCCLYLGAVMVIHPEFMRDVYPVLADTIMKIRFYLPILQQYGLSCALLTFLIWGLWPPGRTPELASVMAFASAAALIPLVYQAKGWPYHAYPAILYAVFTTFCLLAFPASQRRCSSWHGRFSAFVRPGWPIVLLAVLVSHVPFWVAQKPSPELVQAVRLATDKPTVAVISGDISTGHPLNRMIDGRWLSANVSDWLGVFALNLSKRAETAGDGAEAERYASMVVNYATGKREEFERFRPDVIIVSKREANWTNLLTERYGFDAILSNYRILAEDESVRIMLRKDYVRSPAPKAD
jgi:hypothetical protein